ncbi:hypothetical protein [Paraburkholderia ginsengisoli]|uniref:hypothetical protein n=1 Tax=Paraburkholderia ginsengisoli TaxID=311231 RepID=UPI0005A67116|nr:hypothetical protein [Paraburkholderia ginsengisoli]
MTRRSLISFCASNFYNLAKRQAAASGASVAAAALGGVLLVAGSSANAQIPQNSGSAQQDNRTSAMGTTPDPSASMVHESQKPQAKDGGSATSRGKTGKKDHKTQGAGGFDNGLYGTGAGSNK